MVPFLEESWRQLLQEELKKPYLVELLTAIERDRQSGRVIYPAHEHVFQALNLTPFEQVRVVILGQDPYHGEGQAHGLSFSVPPGMKIPPSLQNIIKELRTDLGIVAGTAGNLNCWARQGVLLLNNVLTVETGMAGSHQGKGWEHFTDKIIELLNEKRSHLVFILWGAPAQKKAAAVDVHKHLVLKSVHPSPLSAYRGFFGSRPFSQTNAYLRSNHLGEIDWTISC